MFFDADVGGRLEGHCLQFINFATVPPHLAPSPWLEWLGRSGLGLRARRSLGRLCSTSPAGSRTMTVAHTSIRHPLDGRHRPMFIGGKWVEAASGKTFETRNPATGEVIATVPRADKEDIDRAVAAARAAFEGPWSRFKPHERQKLLLAHRRSVRAPLGGDLHLRHHRHGPAHRQGARQRQPRHWHAALLCRHGHRPPRPDHRELAARRDRLLHRQGTGRRRRRHHPVERADGRLGVEDRPGARHRLHRRAQAARKRRR